jgi:hypothetical protein
MKKLRTLMVALALGALVVAGCSGGGSSSGGQASGTTAANPTADRPASTGKLSIESPRNGQVVTGTNLTLKLRLESARIAQPTTTKIQPDQGHVHVMLDGKLISMNYKLSETLPKLAPGTHLVQVEFVASDHLPFDPRVLTQAAFQVKG